MLSSMPRRATLQQRRSKADQVVRSDEIANQRMTRMVVPLGQKSLLQTWMKQVFDPLFTDGLHPWCHFFFQNI
ncbi:hypothetical protein CIPAW_05G070500 [Carya illinoinensis]|uniref:Uncharacterized protein n=1 Tax=Carya illinoinensis TaxID=32201 RepID=A0A8T1QG66_CARIL|nr:hypothetical protein CIPAW_05G070500 [Carya illinoinensis]